MKSSFWPKMRWSPTSFSSLFPPEITRIERRGGGEHHMKISKIEALLPAASTNKSN